MSEPLTAAARALVRSTHEGDVIGFTGPYGEHVWLGVPYARPPVGEWRWRPPQPALHRDRAVECTSPPPSCAQRIPVYMTASATPGTSIGSEDCLYLNIWCPAFPASSIPAGDERLPVMFWIHGGANVTGQAATYGGGALATTQRVIVVSANYRLGVLGWFRHAALRAAATDPDEQSGNFGTLDLIRALQWVRDNIAAFGGDPGRITLFGESAAATTCIHCSPHREPLGCSIAPSPKAGRPRHSASTKPKTSRTMSRRAPKKARAKCCCSC
jgi:para-nitrobenzyl esterase